MDIFENLFDRCGEAVVIADQQANIAYANGPARSLLGDALTVLTTAPPLANIQIWKQPSPDTLTQCQSSLLQTMVDQPIDTHHKFLLQCNTPLQPAQFQVISHRFLLPSQSFNGILLLIRPIESAASLGTRSGKASDPSALTLLVNRTIFMNRIHHALIKAQRDHHAFMAVLCVDVIRLKAINDTFGYLAGDRLLVDIAHRLTQSLRPTDTLSRLGGDEFTILLEDVSSTSAVVAIAETLHDQMNPPFTVRDCEIRVGINIGISLGNYQTLDADTLLRQADIAMAETKNRFGERYCIFTADMAPDRDNSLHLEMSLRQAIQNNELYLEYQPIFLVRTQKIIGMESLVRWQHPTRGLLAPSQFIPIAEKTGLIIPIGWWVLEESCRQLRAWQLKIPAAQNLFISVNMSSQQFAYKDVLDRIHAILETTCLEPKFLKIEMTESVLIDNSESIIEILEAIRRTGIRLSVDDFGTGYSSLSYLYRFPVDTLKIDRSFLENADSDFEKLEILQSVVRLAWNLGLEVVAEGIETQKHLAQVQALRCESGQGFLFSPPMNQTEMERVLRSQTTS